MLQGRNNLTKEIVEKKFYNLIRLSKLNIFLFWLIAITSLKGRLKEPMVFKDIFGMFLAWKL